MAVNNLMAKHKNLNLGFKNGKCITVRLFFRSLVGFLLLFSTALFFCLFYFYFEVYMHKNDTKSHSSGMSSDWHIETMKHVVKYRTYYDP